MGRRSDYLIRRVGAPADNQHHDDDQRHQKYSRDNLKGKLQLIRPLLHRPAFYLEGIGLHQQAAAITAAFGIGIVQAPAAGAAHAAIFAAVPRFVAFIVAGAVCAVLVAVIAIAVILRVLFIAVGSFASLGGLLVILAQHITAVAAYPGILSVNGAADGASPAHGRIAGFRFFKAVRFCGVLRFSSIFRLAKRLAAYRAESRVLPQRGATIGAAQGIVIHDLILRLHPAYVGIVQCSPAVDTSLTFRRLVMTMGTNHLFSSLTVRYLFIDITPSIF